MTMRTLPRLSDIAGRLARLRAFSDSPEQGAERRRIFLLILSILAVFFACLLAIVGYQQVHFGDAYKGIHWSVLAGMLIGCLGLMAAVRRGFLKSAAAVFLAVYFIGNAYGSYAWGASMPSGLLSYSLFITIAGVILGRRFALIAAGLSAGSIIWNGLREYSLGTLPAWKKDAVTVEDLIAYTVMLALAAFFSWLFTRSVEQSLERALVSEKALKLERDNLEITVTERTQAWKEAELRRSMELSRFIEFGKLSAGLFHDLINPLTAVSLSLEQLQRRDAPATLEHQAAASEAVNRAVRSARRIEEHIVRMRKHMKPESQIRIFDAAAELTDICSVLQYQARKSSIEISCEMPGPFMLYGDPLKFYQACANIIINAIDAFAGIPDGGERRIAIRCVGQADRLILTIADTAGGIDNQAMPRIFDPFFTTKQAGMGLGLATAKDIVMNHFAGTIDCRSQAGVGTTFILSLPLHQSGQE